MDAGRGGAWRELRGLGLSPARAPFSPSISNLALLIAAAAAARFRGCCAFQLLLRCCCSSCYADDGVRCSRSYVSSAESVAWQHREGRPNRRMRDGAVCVGPGSGASARGAAEMRV